MTASEACCTSNYLLQKISRTWKNHAIDKYRYRKRESNSKADKGSHAMDKYRYRKRGQNSKADKSSHAINKYRYRNRQSK
jgi:hypothetical protein